MTNAYVTVDALKGTGALNLSGTAFDSRMRSVAEAVSREIDKYCNRPFYFYIETKYFDGDGSDELELPDFVGIGTLIEDANNDGTYDTAWAATDYIKMPANAQPTSDHGSPFRRLVVSHRTGGTQDTFLSGGQLNYEVAGTWGYRKITKDSGLNGTLTTGTTTTLTADGTSLEIGMTLLVENEQVYVTGINGTAATVERAVNGSTGTAHTNVDLLTVQYPEQVTEAALIQSARLWKRKDSGFATQIGSPELGQVTVFAGLDTDVKQLLSPFLLIAV